MKGSLPDFLSEAAEALNAAGSTASSPADSPSDRPEPLDHRSVPFLQHHHHLPSFGGSLAEPSIDDAAIDAVAAATGAG